MHADESKKVKQHKDITEKAYKAQMDRVFLELANQAKKSKNPKEFFLFLSSDFNEKNTEYKKNLSILEKMKMPIIVTRKSEIEFIFAHESRPLRIKLAEKLGQIYINDDVPEIYFEKLRKEKTAVLPTTQTIWSYLFQGESAFAWASLLLRGAMVGGRLVHFLLGNSIRATAISTGAGAVIGCAVSIPQREQTENYLEGCAPGAMTGAGFGSLASFNKLNNLVRFLTETGSLTVRQLSSYGFIGSVGILLSRSGYDFARANGSILRCQSMRTFTLSNRHLGATRSTIVDYDNGILTFYKRSSSNSREVETVDVPENLEAVQDFFRTNLQLPTPIPDEHLQVLAEAFLSNLEELKETCNQNPGRNIPQPGIDLNSVHSEMLRQPGRR
ncbi:MAG: hypothetical protein ACK5P5_11065 [Pseudobdellovibrionaceae bacterium]